MLLAALSCAATVVSCGDDNPVQQAASKTSVEDMTVSSLGPSLWLPGTVIEITGGPFLTPERGPSKLSMKGAFEGKQVELLLDAEAVDLEHLRAIWPGAAALDLGATTGVLDVELRAQARDDEGILHTSRFNPISIDIAPSLTPVLASIDAQVLFVNDPIRIEGDGFLLGGTEGVTLARFDGCFTAVGEATCVPVAGVEVPTTPVVSLSRASLEVLFSPDIAGIRPGSFSGEIRLENHHGTAASEAVVPSSDVLPIQADLETPALFGFSPANASLGQIVEVAGAGFVGATPLDPAAGTTLELSGTFQATGANTAIPVTLSLIPSVSSGRLARYVMNEEDSLGQLADLRTMTGTFTGTARPVIAYAGATIEGSDVGVSLSIAPVKQVVWVRFMPSYVESLRHLGMRAADGPVRSRVLEVLRRDYSGVNVEFRTDEPTDFALFATLEISGPDPNGAGLLGYDNTPGKDKGNQRLYDRIGGVNALTQLDGYPGYGGVFVESLFVFSKHPGRFAESSEQADEAFDRLFDPFRLDVGGRQATAADLDSFSPLASGSSCPVASGRGAQIECAVFALGSLIGTTASHEFAHSLGLANPDGDSFHNPGDLPGRLMDSGEARPFGERAEIGNNGPAMFCDAEFTYLQTILFTGAPDPVPTRPTCE